MRTFFGVVLIALGLPALAAGAAAAAYTGPDNTVRALEQDLTTESAVLLTSPDVLDIAGLTLHFTADPGDGEIFLGAAHPVHLDSYLDGAAVDLVTDARWRGELQVESAAGPGVVPPVPPADLDWWSEQSTGSGPQRVTIELTDEPVQLVVANSDLSAPVDVQLTAAVELDRLFVFALLIAAAGLVLVVLGVLLIAGRRRKRIRPARREPGGDDQNEARADTAAGASDTAEVTTLPKRTPGQSGMRRVPVIVAAAGAVALTGCAELPRGADHAAHSGVVAVTPQAADAFFRHYTETNNAANAAQDADLIATVETGTLLQSSQLAYEIQQAQGREPIDAFTVEPALVAAPRLDSYPLWFMAVTEPDDEQSGPAYFVITREDAAAPWLASLSVYPSGDMALPLPVVDDGVARLAARDDATRGGAVLRALVDYAETGTEPDGIDLSAAGGLSALPDSGLEIVEGPEDRVSAERECTLRDDAVRWLATESGALAVAAIACTQQVTLDEGYSLSLDEGGYGTIPAGANLVELDITHGVTFVVTVNDDGSATILGESMLPYATDYVEE